MKLRILTVLALALAFWAYTRGRQINEPAVTPSPAGAQPKTFTDHDTTVQVGAVTINNTNVPLDNVNVKVSASLAN